MKVLRDREGVGFHAFDVTLTIESEEEARALYAIFNYGPNTDLLPCEIGKIVREVIGGEYGNLAAGSVIAKGITYVTFYRYKMKD